MSTAWASVGRHCSHPRDEPFTVEVRADLPTLTRHGTGWIVGGRAKPLAIRHRPEPPVIPESVRLRERATDGSVRDAVMTVVGPGRFRLDLPPATASSTFTLDGGDDWLGPIAVERVDRPSLAGVEVRVRDPGTSSWLAPDDRRYPAAPDLPARHRN